MKDYYLMSYFYSREFNNTDAKAREEHYLGYYLSDYILEKKGFEINLPFSQNPILLKTTEKTGLEVENQSDNIEFLICFKITGVLNNEIQRKNLRIIVYNKISNVVYIDQFIN